MNEAVFAKLQYIQQTSGIADLLDFRARTQGQREAIIDGTERVSYNGLKARARVIARHLHDLGVRGGDRVGFFLPSGVDFVAAFFGATGLGAVVVPINPMLKPDEIAHILGDSQSRALIVHQDLIGTVEAALPKIAGLESVLIAAGTTHSSENAALTPLKTRVLDRQLPCENFAWPQSVPSDKMPALIIYTSGTTGKPKGAVLSHHNLLTSFPGRLDMFDVTDNDRLLSIVPMCHIFGVSVSILGSISRGATIVSLQKFDPKAALETIERERITLIPAVPAMYQMMMHEMKQTNVDTSSLRFCWSGGAPCPVEILKQFSEAFGVDLIEGYGLTETSCVSTINPLHGERKAGSVGPALPGVEVEIFGADGNILPTGPDNVGEIAVRGDNIMLGYYNQPQATAEALKDGWFFTGDLGYKDADGYVWIVGRKKELIIRGGANIYPKEVEDVIAKLPGVREVAVIGVPDQYMGERVKAVVATSDTTLTEDRVKEHCQQYLADYKVPRIVEFVQALPRNSTGKVLKRLLT